jgi:hypothetical protein
MLIRQNQREEVVMEREIDIRLRLNLATGKVNLNEIVYKLKEIGDTVMLEVLKKILMSYDDLIVERLSKTKSNTSKDRKGLGRHIIKSEPEGRLCRGRKVRKRGYRHEPRNISTVYGILKLPVRVVECCRCGARYSPLLAALDLKPYTRKETNFEYEVIESVIDTNIELWLETGVIAPKTTSLLERVFREIGRRLKKIAWGWSNSAVTNISKMIMIRQYSRDQWEKYWKKKLDIRGYFNIQIASVQIA